MSALPPPPGRLWGLVSRPSWRELRKRREREALLAHPIWEGEGVPPGEGRHLVLLPGFMAGTGSFRLLEPWLRRCGWETRRAPVGRNDQAAAVVMDLIEPWARETAALEGGPVPVIGHSRGGQEGRVLAVRRPEDVSLLVTLGAPHRVLVPPHVAIRLPIAALQVRAWARKAGPEPVAQARYEADLHHPFPETVPFVNIYSRTDGFLDWRSCLDPGSESVEIDCTHLGLTASVPGFRAIADALGRLG